MVKRCKHSYYGVGVLQWEEGGPLCEIGDEFIKASFWVGMKEQVNPLKRETSAWIVPGPVLA